MVNNKIFKNARVCLILSLTIISVMVSACGVNSYSQDTAGGTTAVKNSVNDGKPSAIKPGGIPAKVTTTNTLSSTPETLKTTTVVPVLTAEQRKAIELYNQGLKLYYQRSFYKAIALFDKALALNPKCYQALNGKGASYAFLGRYSEGILLIKQALQIKPDFEYGYFNLGISNELAGNWDNGVMAYQKAIQLNSKDIWAYYGIASIYGRQGKVDKVIHYLGQAIAINPGIKVTARKEKDFNPVRNNPKFQELIK